MFHRREEKWDSSWNKREIRAIFLSGKNNSMVLCWWKWPRRERERERERERDDDDDDDDDDDKNTGKLIEWYLYEFEMKLSLRHARQL